MKRLRKNKSAIAAASGPSNEVAASSMDRAFLVVGHHRDDPIVVPSGADITANVVEKSFSPTPSKHAERPFQDNIRWVIANNDAPTTTAELGAGHDDCGRGADDRLCRRGQAFNPMQDPVTHQPVNHIVRPGDKQTVAGANGDADAPDPGGGEPDVVKDGGGDGGNDGANDDRAPKQQNETVMTPDDDDDEAADVDHQSDIVVPPPTAAPQATTTIHDFNHTPSSPTGAPVAAPRPSTARPPFYRPASTMKTTSSPTKIPAQRSPSSYVNPNRRPPLPPKTTPVLKPQYGCAHVKGLAGYTKCQISEFAHTYPISLVLMSLALLTVIIRCLCGNAAARSDDQHHRQRGEYRQIAAHYTHDAFGDDYSDDGLGGSDDDDDDESWARSNGKVEMNDLGRELRSARLSLDELNG